MSATVTGEEEAREQLKRALLMRDVDTAQRILLQNPGLLPAQQKAQLMFVLEQAQVERYSFGLARYRNELQALAQKVD